MTDCKGEERTTAEKENTKDFPLADPTLEECYNTSRKNAAMHHTGEKDYGKDRSGDETLEICISEISIVVLHIHFPPKLQAKAFLTSLYLCY